MWPRCPRPRCLALTKRHEPGYARLRSGQPDGDLPGARNRQPVRRAARPDSHGIHVRNRPNLHGPRTRCLIKKADLTMKPFCRALAGFGHRCVSSEGWAAVHGGAPGAPARGAGRRAESIWERVSPARPLYGPPGRVSARFAARICMFFAARHRTHRPQRPGSARKPCDPAQRTCAQQRRRQNWPVCASLAATGPANTGIA